MTGHASWNLSPRDAVAGGRRVVRSLGGGKRTEVLLAHDGASDRLVVVKLLRPGASRGARAAVLAEAELLDRLDHPLFPRLVEVVDERGTALQLVLEHVPGRRLSTVLRRSGPLPPREAVALAATLADGLAELATGGHVHLDVKPANTILSPRPRLVDLGIARSIADAAAVRGTVGSHRFQAPEQHHPERFGGLSPATDVWGVGATVASALRGRSPFGPLRDGDDRRRPLTPADVAALVLPPDVPEEVARLVRDAMAWQPADRPTAADLAVRARRIAGELGHGGGGRESNPPEGSAPSRRC